MDEDGALDLLKEFKSKVKAKIYPISCLTNENIDEFKKGCYLKLQDCPNLTLEDLQEKEAIKVYSLKEEESFNIEKVNSNTFRIYGEKIEKYYAMINLSTDEGILKLISHLRHIGVDDRLEQLGAKNGDTVILCDFEFEYIN